MEEWKEYKLIDVLDKLIDYRGKTPKKTSSGVPLITAKIIKNGRIEHCNRNPRIVIYDSTHILLSLPLGKVVQSDKPTCAHLRVGTAHPAQCTNNCRGTDLYMLHVQRLGSPACRLSQSLMTYTLFHLMCMTAIEMRHRQGLDEYLPAATGICAYKMADIKYQYRPTAKKLCTLYLAQTMAVHSPTTLATTRTNACLSCCMSTDACI